MSGKVTPIRGHLRESSEQRRKRGGGHLPEDCPVTALGNSGQECFYLNNSGQYVELPARHHNKLMLYQLFGQQWPYLNKHWPKGVDEETGLPKDFRPDHVARDLIAACDAEGPWQGASRLRGKGAWRGEDGDLVQHLGTKLMVRGAVQRCGRAGEHVYAVRPPRDAPAGEAQPAGDGGPAAELDRLLRQWNWQDTEVYPRLMLGWLCAAQVCGALAWRPQMWLRAARGSGKSTLVKEVVGPLFGGHERGCLVLDNGSAASVRGLLEHDSVPVLFDEAEPSEDNGRLNELVELMRIAASGGLLARSTADHKVKQFTARFMGLFGSVVLPALKSQDLSRVAVLHLRKIEGGRPPAITEDAMRLLGRRLLRRMTDAWPRLGEAFETWRETMLAHGLDARGADQYGTLLACADVALHDQPPDGDTLSHWGAAVAARTAAARAEEMAEWERCIESLRTSAAPQWRNGQQHSLSEVIAIAARRVSVPGPNGWVRPDTVTAEDAQRALGSCGMRIVPSHGADKQVLFDAAGNMRGFLAVANNHAWLARCFERTGYKARSGASGAWKGVLEEAPGAEKASMKVGGANTRCVLVPLGLVLDAEGVALPGDAERGDA